MKVILWLGRGVTTTYRTVLKSPRIRKIKNYCLKGTALLKSIDTKCLKNYKKKKIIQQLLHILTPESIRCTGELPLAVFRM